MTDALVTSTDSSVAIGVAEFMLSYCGRFGDIWRAPENQHKQASGRFTPTANEGDFGVAGDTASGEAEAIAEVMLVKARKVELDIAETGHTLIRPISYSTGMCLDEDGHIKGCIGAGIHFNGQLVAVIGLDTPGVDQIIRGCDGRPLADRIRILSQLVRFFCEAVGFASNIDAFSSGFVSNFRLAVSDLRDAVREYRDSETVDDAMHSKEPQGNKETEK